MAQTFLARSLNGYVTRHFQSLEAKFDQLTIKTGGDNLITNNILGGATDKLLDASGDPSELRDNLLLQEGTR